MLAIALLLSRHEACFADLVLVLACLATQGRVVAQMRHIPLLLLLLLVCCAGMPLMLLLWVQRGTGNANFVFFLGLGASVAVIIAIVEFSRSAMCQRSSNHTKRIMSTHSSK